MNWEAIGAVAEALGALGVILTLAYLAVQIRQNTLAIRGQAIGNVTQSILSEVLPVAGTGIAEAYIKAINHPGSLSELEHAQLDAWMVGSFIARQNEFFQYRMGTLEESVWFANHNAITENLGHAWGREWWDTLGRNRYATEFVEFVETLPWRETEGQNPMSVAKKFDT